MIKSRPKIKDRKQDKKSCYYSQVRLHDVYIAIVYIVCIQYWYTIPKPWTMLVSVWQTRGEDRLECRPLTWAQVLEILSAQPCRIRRRPFPRRLWWCRQFGNRAPPDNIIGLRTALISAQHYRVAHSRSEMKSEVQILLTPRQLPYAI